MTTEQNALAVPPTIGDVDTLAELLGFALSEFLTSASEYPENVDESARVLFGLAGVFSEASGIVQLPEGWNLALEGARLRKDEIVAARLEELSPEDRALFDEDDQVIILVLQIFFETMSEAFAERADTYGPEAAGEEVSRFLSEPDVHLELLEWARMILGSHAHVEDAQ